MSEKNSLALGVVPITTSTTAAKAKILQAHGRERRRKVMAKETKNEVVERVDEDVVVEVGESNEFEVHRKPFVTSEGKEYWGYYVEGTIVREKNGKRMQKDVTVDFVAKDSGGYEVLDLIFFSSDIAKLVMHEEKMTNERTGKVSRYTVYEIQSTDDDGTMFSYKVKPSRESDKALFQMLIDRRKNGGGTTVAKQG